MSWIQTELRNVLKLDTERIVLDASATYDMVGVYSFGRGLFLRETVVGGATSYKYFYRLKAEHIVMSQLFGWEGAIALSSKEFVGKYVSPQFPTFSCDEKQISRSFLGWLMRRPSFWDDLGKRTKGMGDRRRTLNPESLLSTVVSFPSINEQQRIVARINEPAAKIEEVRTLRREADIGTKKIYGTSINSILKPHLTSEKTPIEQLADVSGGIQKGPHRIPGNNPVRYLTVAHVQRNHISLLDPRFFEVSNKELERLRLMPGDVLIIEGNGSVEQIGRAALFRGEIKDCVHQNHVIRIRPNKELIYPEFLNLFLNSPTGQDEVQSRSRTTSGLRTLSVGRIKQIRVPRLPLSLQMDIVAYSNDLQNRLNIVRQLQEQTTVELDALLPSILDKAFKGEL